MEFFEVIQARRSVRAFTDQPVPETSVQSILEAACRAPSAGNLQAYEIFLIRESAQKERLVQAAMGQEFLAQAPIVLAFCTHAARSEVRYGERGINLYTIQDATIACTFATLAAAALGLASVWVGAFDPVGVHQVLGTPPGVVPAALLPIGYAAEEAPLRVRRPLDELVHKV